MRSTIDDLPQPPWHGPVEGCVDQLGPANVLRGWATQPGNAQPLRIYVLGPSGLLGEGVTGEFREVPAGNCGFSVMLSQAISVPELVQRAVNAFAIGANGEQHLLPIWDQIRQTETDANTRTDAQGGEPDMQISLHPAPGQDLTPSPPARRAQAGADARARRSRKSAREPAFAASPILGAKLYVAGGQLLPPVCIARELYASIERDGLRGFTGEMSLQAVLDCVRNDHLPIPALADREGYNENDDAGYWLYGLDDYHKVLKATQRHELQVGRMLDFGAATGRVSRHFLAQEKMDKVYACDLNLGNVRWCQRHFPPEYVIFLNSVLPTLPFPDGFFDLVLAFSVFTHIDEYEDTWLLELSRILRPGGFAYITIHDEHTWGKMPPYLQDILRASPESAGMDLQSAMPFDRQIFTFDAGSGYVCNVIHKLAYIERFWGRYFEIEEIQPFGHFMQTVVLLRKR